ncbi:bifunctional MaoC family dehydratase N-terminal/OB-fold nucleic acid binding domain-containing protein [Actinomadura sp. 9N215]|uniref:bifunctional MaoC family dehydratase N-terminal/OB-fold nucleic acid binding domain-containing protein n=1 Tax=Actinomadura sp. 9N215 TaxID=3375150 RepID=UPI0037B14582
MSEYEDRLQAWAGRELVARRPGQDPVNVPMIRHWVEAMADENPVYLDEAAARAAGRDGVVAPASMMQAWTMRGYAASVRPDSAEPSAGPTVGRSAGPTVGPSAGPSAAEELNELLAEGGYTSVVATDSEFEFHRELTPGDHVSVEETVVSISAEKQTALGTGRFISTLKTYRDATGEIVATQRWRTLRYRPATPPAEQPTDTPEPSALRPRPAINADNAFWFEAAREHRLVVQRCADCKSLRHPPGPCCPQCGSFGWDTVESSGNGHVYTYAVNHHPRHPAFEHPLIVAVIELAEGTRLIANLTAVAPEDVEIGMPVVLDWTDPDPDLSLPVFRPADAEER